MQEQLREARSRGWCYAGVIPHGDDQWGQTDSVNERRAVEALRFAADLLKMVVKPAPVDWIDSQGAERKYSPDARVELQDGDNALIEMKPKGILKRNKTLTAKYEDIGRFLQGKGKLRFGLMEWQWDTVFARNVSRLSRYWNVEPGTHAVDAFEAIGDCEVSLAQLFERVDRANWPAVWAAVAKQHLTTDMHAGPLTRASRVSQPGVIYEPVLVDTFITTWWA
jgi:hypothetical protein